MVISNPQFTIGESDILEISNDEIADLLRLVYVDAGYTSPEEAKTVFEPTSVRERGILIGARDKESTLLAGMIIVVPASSLASRFAKTNETELHLLGVVPDFRGCGLGRMLVNAAIERVLDMGCTKIILWTQHSMRVAQKLYESLGFVYTHDFAKNGRDFKVYQYNL